MESYWNFLKGIQPSRHMREIQVKVDLGFTGHAKQQDHIH